MAGFNDKNKKENIVESSKPKCTQVSKVLFIIITVCSQKQKSILHAWQGSTIKTTKKTL
jgi:hypothetical protein